MQALYLTLIYLHVFISIVLILLVIIQKTTGNGLFTTSQTNPFLSGTEITHFITKLTVFFIALFFINTLALAKISYITNSHKRNLLVQETTIPEDASVPISD